MPAHNIDIRLASVLERRGMTLAELSRRTGIAVVNLSQLKNNHAKAVRFTTLSAICAALECEPGELLGLQAGSAPTGAPSATS
ncbi:hypothetical protein ASE14_01020 [Agromyces sp. Root81]|uniref:helix-turn-helix domain-containing protein n=1 Tax=Agromyces sp. Root81 TaxID=1736601 RepID=UPI0006F7A5E3|nr:helix-turn-helix transcriptional regulator [Agromyces sp. Root81]KRC62450.1 hypothetical protein ASE14_01020 [Agromyces sp. Root81]